MIGVRTEDADRIREDVDGHERFGDRSSHATGPDDSDRPDGARHEQPCPQRSGRSDPEMLQDTVLNDGDGRTVR